MSDGHSHGDAHDHDFDPEPATSLSEGEPTTPSWLPILGAGLFLIGGIWFLAGETSATPTASSATATASAGAAVGAAPIAPKRPVPAQAAQPAPGGSGGKLQVPQDPAERQKLIDALKKRREDAKKSPTALPAPGRP